MASRCRQNYHEECEAAINKQINMELFASYSYTALVSQRLITFDCIESHVL